MLLRKVPWHLQDISRGAKTPRIKIGGDEVLAKVM